MNLLQQKIIERIQAEGPLTFRTFMEMALYEPELGYYASEKIKIGREGDFYTSSHLHPVFGMMVGKQILEMWRLMDRPSDFQLVEMGSGAGYLCMDMLEYFKRFGEKEALPDLNYTIVEVNPAMREHQKKLLSGFSDKISWVSSLKELKNIRGCILSNELLDAFPVHIIEMTDKWNEILVNTDGENLFETKNELGSELSSYLNEFSIELQGSYRTEINLEIKNWLQDVNNALEEGFVFTIDYGYPAMDYYYEDRNRGTLLCYHKHQVVENPYLNIGEQDITAHVNFSSLKKWGEEIGLKTTGFCQQGTFLISLGIDEEISRLHKESPDYLFEIAKIKKLILPGTLGETHKVMIQYKGDKQSELKGFSIKNQKGKL